MPELLRTPDHYFEGLPDFPYAPNYIKINGANVHYIHEGKTNKETLLLLHGNPTWSFMYRYVIAAFSSEYQVIAPDFIGFGKSDKYARQEDYSYELHLEMLLEFIRCMDIERATLVGSNWGAMLGLRALEDVGERFERLVIMNAYLPLGNKELPHAFLMYKEYVLNFADLLLSEIINAGMFTNLSSEIADVYNAPFPSGKYQKGVKAFVNLVPDTTIHPVVKHMKKARTVVKKWNKPVLLIYAKDGRVAGGAHVWYERNMPNAQIECAEIEDARHFMLEDRGEEIVGHLRTFLVN